MSLFLLQGATERKFQGAKGPGSELARERIGPSSIGRFAPGSELAWERGCLKYAGTDAGTVRQRRKTPRLAPGQVCDAGTDVGTDCQHLTLRLSLHTQSETPGQVNSDKHAS